MQTLLDFFQKVSDKISGWDFIESLGSVGFIVLAGILGLLIFAGLLWLFTLILKINNFQTFFC